MSAAGATSTDASGDAPGAGKWNFGSGLAGFQYYGLYGTRTSFMLNGPAS